MNVPSGLLCTSVPNRIMIVEVGPRDGLQNESFFVPTATKIEFLNRLSKVGYTDIEVTSFVSPKWIPQLADAEEVLLNIERQTGVTYSALVPNEQGLERAFRGNVDGVNVFMSASETHNRKNINKSIVDTYPVLKPVIEGAKQQGKKVRGYVSTAFGCPYEGRIATRQVVEVCSRLLDLGVDEVSIGDTIGVAVPTQVTSLLAALADRVPLTQVALHFHDTRGTAMANIFAGMLAGIARFDASIGGLGGCPYAKGASGNVATEDVLYMLQGMGVATGLDEVRLRETAAWFETQIGKPLQSHASAVCRSQEV